MVNPKAKQVKLSTTAHGDHRSHATACDARANPLMA